MERDRGGKECGGRGKHDGQEREQESERGGRSNTESQTGTGSGTLPIHLHAYPNIQYVHERIQLHTMHLLTHTTLHMHTLLTKEEVLVLPVVGHFPPPLLPPFHRNHISKEKHVWDGDVRVLQILYSEVRMAIT